MFEDIEKHLYLQSSTGRLGHLIDHLDEVKSKKEFWHLIHAFWSSCDTTWDWQDDLQILFYEYGNGTRYFKKEQREFYKSLPKAVSLFRGCSSSRVMGVSWTTDFKVASGFARGHRGIDTPDPVMAKAEIPKSLIYSVCVDREESEVLWLPNEKYIQVEPFER
jgi:hypothetical protein